MEKIKVTIRDIVLYGELYDTGTANAVAGILPLDAIPEEWGDEFYFEIPVEMPLDKSATTRVKIGDIGYWPPGNALAIFFGPTPISKGFEPVPASEVNIVGRIMGDATLLSKAKGAHTIRIERASE
jgi:hypothetical protein